jgi:hypothetical protein
MRVLPQYGEPGRDRYNGRTTLVPSDPNGRFRLVGRGGLLIVDGEARPPYIGTKVEIEGVPDYAASQLPYQPNDNLLDHHLPPDPERPNVRTTGGHMLHLFLEDGSEVRTRPGAFEELASELSQPEV